MPRRRGIYAPGYCYLRLFAAYNQCQGEEVLNLWALRKQYGPSPLVRLIVGHLISYAQADFYVPMIKLVAPNLYHVDPSKGVVLFSEVATSVIFSAAKIGGLVDNDDPAIRVNQAVTTFARMCDAAGIDVNAAMNEASRKQLIEQMREPTAELRNIFKPLVENSRRSAQFKVNYTLTPQEIASIQREFPELNVVVTGKSGHPHVIAARFGTRDRERCCNVINGCGKANLSEDL